MYMEPSGKVGTVQTLGGSKQGGALPALASKAQGIYYPAPRQHLHAPPCKAFRRGERPGGGQLQDQVRPSLNRPAGPPPLVRNGALSPLDPVSRHNRHYGGLLPKVLADLPDQALVACVKGVVFCNNSCNCHKPSFLE